MIAAEVEPVDPEAARRSSREAVDLEIGIGRGGLDRALCRVTDLSLHGARLETYSALRRGSLVWLTLPGMGARAAKITRADDFSAGCEFLHPLHRAEFKALVAMDATLDRNGG